MKNFMLVLVGALALAIWVKSRSVRPADAAATAAQPASAAVAHAAPAEDANGWTAVPMPDGADTRRVLVFSAMNCPKAAAQRALAIVGELGEQGIPCVHTDQISFAHPGPNDGERLAKVMNVGGPVVFVNGKAKSWPMVDEVVAEYRAIGRQ